MQTAPDHSSLRHTTCLMSVLWRCQSTLIDSSYHEDQFERHSAVWHRWQTIDLLAHCLPCCPANGWSVLDVYIQMHSSNVTQLQPQHNAKFNSNSTFIQVRWLPVTGSSTQLAANEMSHLFKIYFTNYLWICRPCEIILTKTTGKIRHSLTCSSHHHMQS